MVGGRATGDRSSGGRWRGPPDQGGRLGLMVDHVPVATKKGCTKVTEIAEVTEVWPPASFAPSMNGR